MQTKNTKTTDGSQKLRFGIYARYSSEMQNDLSLEDQERFCRRAVAEMGGVIIKVYKDGVMNGWSLERPGLDELRRDASKGKLDALMMWKFDRLMRDHDQNVVLKLLLRREYGLKLFCVEGFSEDEDDSPYAAMMEQMLAIFAAFYSKNLSIDAKRHKRARAEQGKFNGSEPPLGYDLVTAEAETPHRPAGLYINPRQAAIVRRAFRMYATGEYSDGEIALWMNERPLIQALRAGQKPIDKEMVRHMLQNKVYTGRVSHCDTQYINGMGQGRKSSRKRKEWFDGIHQPIISDELFQQCEQVRAGLASHHKTSTKMHTYILHDRVYCARCVANKPQDLDDALYGKMGPYYQQERGVAHFQCKTKIRGYQNCGQPPIKVPELDAQLLEFLSHLRIPEGYRARIEAAIQSRVEHEVAFKRMAEIQEVLTRMDFRWDNGLFLNPAEYLEQRKQLQRELESLRPIDYDELLEAADLLENFRQYWEECAQVDKPDEARQQLVAKIVDRVFVEEKRIVGVVLHGDFAVILNKNAKAPSELTGALDAALSNDGIITSDGIQNGADGVRSFAGRRLWVPRDGRCHLVIGQLVPQKAA
jgi:DNA invertase Pin-like site-specific DNA recombinase